jgi:hypothetical protein
MRSVQRKIALVAERPEALNLGRADPLEIPTLGVFHPIGTPENPVWPYFPQGCPAGTHRICSPAK